MNHSDVLNRLIKTLSQLPTDKIKQVADFADLIPEEQEEKFMLDNIQYIVDRSESFDFLNHEENLYTAADIKEFWT